MVFCVGSIPALQALTWTDRQMHPRAFPIVCVAIPRRHDTCFFRYACWADGFPVRVVDDVGSLAITRSPRCGFLAREKHVKHFLEHDGCGSPWQRCGAPPGHFRIAAFSRGTASRTSRTTTAIVAETEHQKWFRVEGPSNERFWELEGPHEVTRRGE